MLYSSNEELRNSSSDFWCAVLSSRKEKAFPELGSCNLLQSFLNNELNSLVELAAEKVLHSSNEELRNSSSDFWCAILSCGKEILTLENHPKIFESGSNLSLLVV
ncbi:uncharacterized protein [Arachis hypogaea]|uniref:uncharacterized protein isoform X5 n=2 Tax=Arachis hypogaea TaxID=3818 RepID=UPI003B2134A3